MFKNSDSNLPTFDHTKTGTRLQTISTTEIAQSNNRTENNNRVFHKTSNRTKPIANNPAHDSFRRGNRLNQNRFNAATDSVRFKK
ncbi:hypothetical protein INT47_013192 [Mucor saturninus]|uniref:Uncharacterized protein n=1 Tax=Mucor saturninus TaxID=64648 RepID=A0A8H7QJ72_9FUNG|nr:hypothetical protein INT47_013192 [Mucor saturninus]